MTAVYVDVRHLKPADRCDKCGAQAFVLTEIAAGGELLFCGHHYARYELALLAVASHVIDERRYINAHPSPST